MDTPIGQFVLIGNFRRRLARELLVCAVAVDEFMQLPEKVYVLSAKRVPTYPSEQCTDTPATQESML